MNLKSFLFCVVLCCFVLTRDVCGIFKRLAEQCLDDAWER